MKKRLLSLLLLVTMIVTAFPLVALPTVAAEAEEKTYTADAYNVYYVRDGLIYAADFFRTNSYWGGAAESYTTNTDYKAAIASSEWLLTTGITWAVLSKGTVSIADGYLSFSDTNDIPIGGLAKAAGFLGGNVTNTAGATADLLMQTIGGTIMFNNVRTAFSAKTFSSVHIQNQDYYSFKDPKTDGNAVTTEFYDRPANMTISFVIPELTESLSWGATKLKDGSALGTPIDTSKSPSAAQKYDAYAGEYIEVDGEQVLSIAASPTRLSPFFQPSMITVPSVEYQAGEKLETPLENVLVFFPETQSVIGTYKLMQDGTLSYENTETPFLNNDYSYDSAYVQWASCTGKYYALRYYNRAITEAEAAQNHFADLLKWFRLDLSHFEDLTTAQMAELYAVAKAYNISSDRDAVTAALYPLADEYAAANYREKYEGSVDDAILAVGVLYDLDLAPMVGMPRGLLANTYTLLLGDLSGVADVPAAYEKALNDDIAAYAALSSLTFEDYNDFYVFDDSAILMADFFRYNDYWGETYTMPTPIQQQSAFEYEGTTYDFTDEDVALDWHVKITFTDNSTETLSGFDKKAEAEAAVAAKKTEAEKYTTATYLYYPSLSTAYSSARENSYRVLLDRFIISNYWYRTGTNVAARVELPSVGPQSYQEKDTKNMVAPFTLGKGYLAMTKAYGAGSYLNMSSIPNETVAPNITGEYVMAVGDKTGSTGLLPILHDVCLTGSFAGGALTVKGVGSYTTGVTAKDWAAPYSISLTPTQTFTLGMQVDLGADGASYDFTAFANGVPMADEMNLPDTAPTKRGSTLYYSSSLEPDLYAFRFYKRDLTADERAQNHFADVVKFFRLNVNGFAALDEAAKLSLYAAVADIDLGDTTRVEAQAAVTRELSKLTKASYDAMKVEGATAFNAFLDLAYEYSLDLTEVLASSRDMSSVFETVTADALSGKSVAEAQAILDEAYADAYYYLSYKVADTKVNAEKWNAQLVWCAENVPTATPVNLDDLATLPWSVRSEIEVPTGSVAAAQEHIDAFVAEALASYDDTGVIDYDYNSLYVQNGLFFSLDFFSTNEYWNNAPVRLGANNEGDKVETGNGGPLASFINYKEGTFTFGKNGDLEAIVENGGLRLLNSSGSIWLNMTFQKGQLTNTDYDYTVENVFRYGTTNSGNQFYHRGNWFQVATSNPGTENAAITFQKMYSQFNSYGLSGGKYGLFGFWNILHTFGTQPKATVGTGANTFSFVYRLGEYLESPTSPVNGTVPAVELYMPAATDPVFAASSLKGQLLQTDPDCLNSDGTYDSATDPGHYGVDPASIRSSWTDRIGYGGFDGYTYAVRYYNRALSQTETLQNHFADLAKFYRLDVSLLSTLTPELYSELYADMAAYEIGSATRGELQMVLDAVTAKTYDGIVLVEDAEQNAVFLRIAAPAGLDLSRIKNLSASGREAIVAAMIDELAPAYKVNKVVVGKLYDDLTYSLGALTFAGYQVRIDTGAVSQNYAGVRGVFDVNEEIVKTLAADETVTLTVAISVDGVVGSTIAITYDAETDTLRGVMTTGDKTEDVIFYERDGKTSFNYTVVYKGDAANAENYAVEYGYAYTITVGETTVDFAVKSETFGETVSAFELYEYFSTLPEYENDRVIAGVLALAE